LKGRAGYWVGPRGVGVGEAMPPVPDSLEAGEDVTDPKLLHQVMECGRCRWSRTGRDEGGGATACRAVEG
jgi:hypothetical protein